MRKLTFYLIDFVLLTHKYLKNDIPETAYTEFKLAIFCQRMAERGVFFEFAMSAKYSKLMTLFDSITIKFSG